MSSLKFDLWKGDCLELMKEIPDGSVDCVISDIPYGIDFEGWDVTHNNTNSALLGQSPKNINSTVFKKRGKPLNGWSQQDKYRKLEFQNWCSGWLNELYRILKPCSPLLIMCGRQNQHRFTVSAEDCGFILKDIITWNKGKAPFRGQKISNIYNQRCLPIDYQGDWRLGNLAPFCEPIVYMFKPYDIGSTITDRFIESKLGCFNADILKSNIININSLPKNVNHPTEKPIELMETLISLVSYEGSVILDLFSGSFSTAIACLNTDRNFIGIELDDSYFDIGVNRIKEHIESNNMDVDLRVKD